MLFWAPDSLDKACQISLDQGPGLHLLTFHPGSPDSSQPLREIKPFSSKKQPLTPEGSLGFRWPGKGLFQFQPRNGPQPGLLRL